MCIQKLLYKLIFGVIFLLASPIWGQEQDSIENDNWSLFEINKLDTSTILIRLNSQQKRVEYRKKAGKDKQLKKLLKEIEKEHSQIINSAIEHLKFADFAFFYSHDSEAVLKEKNYSLLFDANKNKLEKKDFPNSVHLLSLEKPSWYPQVDRYFFILYKIGNDGVERFKRPMPHIFKTGSNNLFKRYDFNKSFKSLNSKLTSFQKNRIEYDLKLRAKLRN